MEVYPPYDDAHWTKYEIRSAVALAELVARNALVATWERSPLVAERRRRAAAAVQIDASDED